MDLLREFISVSEKLKISSNFILFDSNTLQSSGTLSQKELDIFSRSTSLKRRHEFISGRIACKKAFFKLTSQDENCFEKFPSISVLNEESGAPFIENSDLFVSISHSHGVAIASVSKKAVGIDIEETDPKKISALKRMSAESHSEDVCDLTVLWTLKESLGKALRTGIIENFRYYDIKNLRYENGVYRCDFENFPSYSGTAITNGQYAIAIVRGYREL
ncbi:MAG: 4'-phosphopantetheinyl transferase superfamily protein [Alphaproteobacteria bacterium]|nr:4'-phosphopantetheinyl transferase superfamily protein [Alphaproteobacteria bacterium]